MYKKTKWTSALFASSLIVSSIVAPISAEQVNVNKEKAQLAQADRFLCITFKDGDKVPEQAKIATAYLVKQKIISGVNRNGNLLFEQNGNVTRAQASTIFAQHLKLTKKAKNTFHDIKGHKALNDILAVVHSGILDGKTTNTFAPESKLTRAELAMMLVKAFKLTGKANINSIVDSNHKLKKYLEIAVANGIITSSGNRLSPNEQVTRWQFASMYYGALKKANKVIEESIPAVTYSKVPVSGRANYFVDEYTLYKYNKSLNFTKEMVSPLGGQIIDTIIDDKLINRFSMLKNISGRDFIMASLGIHPEYGVRIHFLKKQNGEEIIEMYSNDPLKKIVFSTSGSEEAKAALKKLFPVPLTFNDAEAVQLKGQGKRIFTIEFNNKKDDIVLDGIYYTFDQLIKDINAQTIHTGVKADALYPNYATKYIRFVAPIAIKDSEIVVKGMDDMLEVDQFRGIVTVPGYVKP